jgi:hypothetical protein
MSYVVISSFENVDIGDLQAQGESIAVFATEASARAHYANRSTALAAGVSSARASDPGATFISWVLLLKMPLEVHGVDSALEDLELILEESDSVDDPFGEFVVAYEGSQHEPASTADYPLAEALRGLEAWLT